MATRDKTVSAGISWEAGDRNRTLINPNIAMSGVQTGDVVQVLYIPAETYVRQFFCRIVTGDGATVTATAGDADGANSWDASVNLAAAVNTITFSVAGTDAYMAAGPGGKLYTVADTIDLTVTTDADMLLGVITVWADTIKLG